MFKSSHTTHLEGCTSQKVAVEGLAARDAEPESWHRVAALWVRFLGYIRLQGSSHSLQRWCKDMKRLHRAALEDGEVLLPCELWTYLFVGIYLLLDRLCSLPLLPLLHLRLLLSRRLEKTFAEVKKQSSHNTQQLSLTVLHEEVMRRGVRMLRVCWGGMGMSSRGRKARYFDRPRALPKQSNLPYLCPVSL